MSILTDDQQEEARRLLLSLDACGIHATMRRARVVYESLFVNTKFGDIDLAIKIMMEIAELDNAEIETTNWIEYAIAITKEYHDSCVLTPDKLTCRLFAREVGIPFLKGAAKTTAVVIGIVGAAVGVSVVISKIIHR